MEKVPSDITGVHATATYTGRHRENQMSHGIGFIPLGDRGREVMEYGVSVVEERGSDPNIRRI